MHLDHTSNPLSRVLCTVQEKTQAPCSPETLFMNYLWLQNVITEGKNWKSTSFCTSEGTPAFQRASFLLFTPNWCTGLDLKWMPFNTGTDECVCSYVHQCVRKQSNNYNRLPPRGIQTGRLLRTAASQSFSPSVMCGSCAQVGVLVREQVSTCILTSPWRPMERVPVDITEARGAGFPPYQLGRPNKHSWF